MSPSLVFTPEAEDQLAELYRYIAAAGSAEVAARYTEAIVASIIAKALTRWGHIVLPWSSSLSASRS